MFSDVSETEASESDEPRKELGETIKTQKKKDEDLAVLILTLLLYLNIIGIIAASLIWIYNCRKMKEN